MPIDNLNSAVTTLLSAAKIGPGNIYVRSEDGKQKIGLSYFDPQKDENRHNVEALLSWLTGKKEITFMGGTRSGDPEAYILVENLDPEKINALLKAGTIIEAIHEKNQLIDLPLVSAQLYLPDKAQVPIIWLNTNTTTSEQARQLQAELLGGEYADEEFLLPKNTQHLKNKISRYKGPTYGLGISLETEVLQAVENSIESLIAATIASRRIALEAATGDNANQIKALSEEIAGLYRAMQIPVEGENVQNGVGNYYKATIRATPDQMQKIVTKLQLLTAHTRDGTGTRFFLSPTFEPVRLAAGQHSNKVISEGDRPQNFVLSVFPDSQPPQDTGALDDLDGTSTIQERIQFVRSAQARAAANPTLYRISRER